MSGFRKFVRQSFIGGLLVVLPTTILVLVFNWIFNTIEKLIAPLSVPLARRIDAPDLVIDLFVILMILTGCFLIGTVASTGAGRWIHKRFDSTLAKLAPGYNLVRDIIYQFFGDNPDSPFRQGDVAKVRLFGDSVPTETTAIVTSIHENGWYTVFIPTGPNPTSGLIYHLPSEQVSLLRGIKVDEALKTIIACGAGTAEMFAKAEAEQHEPLQLG
jgi:uncharacterized membrane protein